MANVIGEFVAIIRADMAGFSRDLTAAEKRFQLTGQRLTSIGRTMSMAITAPIVAIGALSIKSAMEAVESENLFSVSMGKMEESARKFSESLRDELGLNSFEVRKNTGVIYNMVSSMGLATDAAYDMATGITKLAYDMASFYNLPSEEAFAKLRAGITGETEPLKRLGILVDEATIKTVAYAHGIATQGEELTQQQKVMARYLAILDQTSNAQGDLARTIDSPTNKLRILKSRIEEAGITFGVALLPAFEQVIKIVEPIVKNIGAMAEKFGKLPEPVQKIVIILTAVVALSGPLLMMIGSLIQMLPMLGIAFHAALGPIGLITLAISALIAAGVALYMYWNNVVDFIQNATNWIIGYINILIDALNNLPFFQLSHIADVSFQSLKRTTKAVDELTASQKQLQEPINKTTEAINKQSDALDGLLGTTKKVETRMGGGGGWSTSQVWANLRGQFGYSTSKAEMGELFGVPFTQENFPHIFEPYQHGGIISKPTVALMGEKGREAVIPLEGEDRIPIDNVITTNIILDGKVVGKSVSKYIGEATLSRQRMGG